MKSIINYFIRGLLVVFPLGATFFVTGITIDWLNNLSSSWIPGDWAQSIPGLGLVLSFAIIVAIGLIFSITLTKPIIHVIEKILTKTPIISIIYHSLKDLTEAFVGEKKKFDRPVLVQLSADGPFRIGFITQENFVVNSFELTAVYCPHSYNFSGNLFLVDTSRVHPVDIDPSQAMRLIVSGGVSQTGKI
tara:strand:+ start:74 stop:643 length:570 start_codon:yes stop_codon:yes gene_type:complete